MLPEGWKEVFIKDVSNNTMGYAFKSKDFTKSGIQLLRMGNLYKNKLDLDRDPVFLPNTYSNEYVKFLVKKNDLVLSMTGTMGKRDYGFVVKIPKNCNPLLLNQRVMRISPNHQTFTEYLYQLLISEKFLSSIYSLPGGTKQANISATHVENISIRLPPLPEQKKIAAILSTWDRAIEGTEKLLANSQQQKKALMQQLLTGKKRLPGFTGEWRVCSLSDVATVQTATSKTQYICENGARFIVDMGSVNRLGNLVCTKSTQHNEDLLPKGTLVMPKDDIGGGNIIGRTSYIDRDDLYVLGDHVYALHINNCDSKFLHFLINSNPINKNLRRMANGTAQLGLGKKDVLKQKIKIPSQLSEQKVIATVLTTADEEMIAIESDLSRLRQEKKALMQQLLTGKRRVKVD